MVQVHGHRGARAVRPENTMSAFRYAIQADADYLELDVVATRDDVLVVAHDPMLNSVVQRGERPGASTVIRELPLEEVRRWDVGSLRHPRFPRQAPVPGERIPTLDEVLNLGGEYGIQFNIEVKSYPHRPEFAPPPPRFARLVADALRRHELQERAIIQSFDFRVLHAMKVEAPHVRLAALYESGREDFVSIAREAGARIVAPQHTLVTPEKVEAARRKGLQIIPWTANTRGNWERLLRARVDGIITDDPGGLVEWLRARGLRRE